MSALRWHLTIKLFRLLIFLGLPGVAEAWSEYSGLRAILEAQLRSLS